MADLLGIAVHVWADYVAAIFALLACILCVIQIHHHLYYNHQPETRKYIIRILLMVIVYCIESWFGLYSPSFSLYLDTIRDTYEAMVIYSFYSLLIYSLGGYENVQHQLYLIPMATFPHIFPFNLCCKQWSFAQGRIGYNSFLRHTTIGVLQYCFVQPLCAIITFVLHKSHCHCYGEGVFSYKVGYPYICFIISASQTWAIYCLVIFYLALKKQPIESEGYQLFNAIRPIPKFLCIKGVIFFTYWQSIAVSGLVYLDVIKATDTWTSNNIAIGIQDILICIEMFFAAIMHIYAFKVDDFTESGYSPLVAPHKVLFDVANVTDIFIKDASKHMFRRTNTSLLHEENYEDENAIESSQDESGLDDSQNEEQENQKTTKRRLRRNVKIVKNKNGINSKQSNLERDLCGDAAL